MSLVDYGLIPDDRSEHLSWTAVTEGSKVTMPAYGPVGELELSIVEELQ